MQTQKIPQKNVTLSNITYTSLAENGLQTW